MTQHWCALMWPGGIYVWAPGEINADHCTRQVNQKSATNISQVIERERDKRKRRKSWVCLRGKGEREREWMIRLALCTMNSIESEWMNGFVSKNVSEQSKMWEIEKEKDDEIYIFYIFLTLIGFAFLPLAFVNQNRMIPATLKEQFQNNFIWSTG